MSLTDSDKAKLADIAQERKQRELKQAKLVADKYIAADGGKPQVVSDVADVAPVPEGKRGTVEQGAVLLDDTEAFLGRFVIYPSEHARVAHVLWIAHAHLMDVWDSTPRLAFLSPEPSSGKTRALEISELLVPLPVEAVNVSPAYLFRKVGSDEGLPTILYDEIDTVFGPKAKENEEIRGLLNAGHRRGAVAGRCVVQGNTVKTEEIPAYCAVALAGLGWLPDTILSRSIIVRMRKRKPGETIKPFRRRSYEKEGHVLRDRLSCWATSMESGLIGVWPSMPQGIEDRNADIWEALLAVADAAGGEWPKRARAAAIALVNAAREVEPSLGVRLLADLKTVFGEANEMPTEAILHALHALKESPWNDLKGKPLNDRGLAHRLKQYEVKPKVIRVGDSTPRGYTREDLYDAWERYVPALPPSPPGGSATSATDATVGKSPSLFSDEFVADGGERSATELHASATGEKVAANVADLMMNVADDVADKCEKNTNKTKLVSDVADVALLAGGERDQRVCSQCGAGPSTEPPGDPPTIKVMNGKAEAVWLHDEPCRKFWLKDHPSDRVAQ